MWGKIFDLTMTMFVRERHSRERKEPLTFAESRDTLIQFDRTTIHVQARGRPKRYILVNVILPQDKKIQILRAF